MGAGASTPRSRRATEPPRMFSSKGQGGISVVDSDVSLYSSNNPHAFSTPTSLFRYISHTLSLTHSFQKVLTKNITFRLSDSRLRSLATLAYRTYPALRDPSLWKHVYHESSELPKKVVEAVSSQLQEGSMCRRKITRKLSQQLFVSEEHNPPPSTSVPRSPESKIQDAARRSSMRRQFHASRHVHKPSKRGTL